MTTSRWILASLLAGPLALAHADDVARCGSKLIEPGMSQADVLQHCGEPTSRTVEEQAVRSGNRAVGTTQVERWTYSDYSATRVFVFDQQKLVRNQ
jgi:hypothetical protein